MTLSNSLVDSRVYEAVARILPTMGKDFTLKIEYDGTQLSIGYHALTDLGVAIQPFVQYQLPIVLKQIEKESHGRTAAITPA